MMLQRLRHRFCGTERMFPARLFLAVAGSASECPCCSFWRGALFGGCLGALAGAALFLARF